MKEENEIDCSKWLESLKVGDEVALSDNWHEYSIMKVTKVTATQIVTKYGRYRKKDGFLVGGSGYLRSSICPLTNEIKYKIKKLYLTNKLSNVLSKLSYEQIDRIEQVIDEVKK